MIWIQIRAKILSVLIWVQTVCKGYQQTTKVAGSMFTACPAISVTYIKGYFLKILKTSNLELYNSLLYLKLKLVISSFLKVL